MKRQTRRMQKKKSVIKDKKRKTFIEEFKKFVDEYDRAPDIEEINSDRFSINSNFLMRKMCRQSTLRRRLEKGYYNFA